MIEVTKPRAIALGYFDGVHLGHRALMQRAVERAKQIGGTSAVFTFDVHPDSVVMGRQVPLLTANAYRTEEIKKLGGVDAVSYTHLACNVRQCVIYYQCKMISNRKEWPSATPYALLGENFSVRRDGFAGKADRSPRRGTGKAFV